MHHTKSRFGIIAYQVVAWAMIAAIAWMIHGFSLQNGSQSDVLSKEVTDVVAVILHPDKTIKRNSAEFERLHWVVRKGAHASEYALLGFAGMIMLAPFKMHPLTKLVFVLTVCAAFAGYDEWTQASSLGRTPAARDVLIDTGGALTGGVLSLMIRQMILWDIRHRMRNRRSAPIRFRTIVPPDRGLVYTGIEIPARKRQISRSLTGIPVIS